MKTSHFYNLLSPFYFLIDAGLKRHKAELIHEVNLYPESTILEIGIGHGTHLKHYVQETITAIDISTKMLEQAKLNNSNKNQKTKYDRLVSEHDEEKEQFLIQQNGYEQRIQKLRKTIKSLQDSSGDRALQAEQAVEAVENELRGQIQTIKNQFRTCKRTLETTRSELSTSQEQYETVQRQMEKDAIRLQQLDRQLLKEKNDRHNREEQEKNSIKESLCIRKVDSFLLLDKKSYKTMTDRRIFRNELEIILIDNIYDILKYALVDNDFEFNQDL